MELKEQITQDLKALGGAIEQLKQEAGADVSDLKERVKGVEDLLSKSRAFSDGGFESKSVGHMLVESDQFKSFAAQRSTRSGGVQVGSFFKTAIVNATGQNQPLVPAYRIPGVMAPGQQRLTVRDLLSTLPTQSNMIEFCKETSSTNAAAPQGKGSSPQVYENVAKAESALGFTLVHEPVQTLAHWIPISRQVLDDGPALQGYVNGRMMYFLKLKEEGQLLNGGATGGDLNGLITQATAYDTSANVVGDTYIDTLSHALSQVDDSNYEADAIVINNKDWEKIRLIKTTGTSSSGEYIFGDPKFPTAPSLWGKPVVATKSMAAGHFLVGAFAMGATLWDRQTATVEVSRDYSDYFVKNMAAILCEERLALTVFQADAFRYGAFPS
jgi:HK97 family phage major capsid protein